ncbi:OLC1v1028726C1 [Oldenlandia corymbosa var. corymbosa]|uniref:OLC1v1028726C1 n=1 Tax=Oldenlandia corymbosa var. corymbosa TaxID=529605 RepID=A0AAV1CCV2_OLDCO|nr:OLC1v1028726C1 [Oldenlandia corymbosa var. corymbosa]
MKSEYSEHDPLATDFHSDVTTKVVESGGPGQRSSEIGKKDGEKPEQGARGKILLERYQALRDRVVSRLLHDFGPDTEIGKEVKFRRNFYVLHIGTPFAVHFPNQIPDIFLAGVKLPAYVLR